MSAFGLLDQVQVGDTGPAESTRRGNLQRVGLLFLGSRDSTGIKVICSVAGDELFLANCSATEPQISSYQAITLT